MKRSRVILTFPALVLALTLAQAALAANYWICPKCDRRVSELVGDMCPYCGYERHVHDWAPATCVSPATCRTCGETEGAPDPENHVGTMELRGQKATTCLEAGYSGDTCCSACGQVVEKGRKIPVADHWWEAGEVLQEATCAMTGKQIYTCVVCGRTEERVLPVDPAHHAGATELRDSRPATCGAAGYTGDTYCLDCGRKAITGRTLPATGRHDWQAATCTAPKTCRVCGLTEGTPAGHPWDAGRVIHPATCQVEGVIRYTCAACGEIRTEILPADPAAHRWDDGSVLYPATCTAEGVARYTCTVCGETGTRILPLDPEHHEEPLALRNERRPACTEAGYTGDAYCPACGALVRPGEIVPAPGHDWQAATCTAPKTCRVCGATEGTAVSHEWDPGEIVQPATCGAAGRIRYRCRSCGETREETIPADLDHHAGGREVRNARAAACEEAGYTGDTCCAVCGAKLLEGTVLPATGHVWQAVVGTARKTCRVCGKTEEVPSTPVAVGDIVTFGHYEQDNNTLNGPEAIQWQVLEVDEANGRALLLSTHGLDAKPYNDGFKEVTWATCTLRAWLNEAFPDAAFSKTEQDAIVTADVDNSRSQGYSGWDTDGGADTRDGIFLLSYAEAKRYFDISLENTANIPARVAPTAYAKARQAWIYGNYKTADGDAAGWWWLRSSGTSRDYAAGINPDGSLYDRSVSHLSGYVRPALWVRLDAGSIRLLE